MPASLTAYEAFDGTLFRNRSDAEAHELELLLREKFGEQKAIELRVIIEERGWFEAAFAQIKKAVVSEFARPAPVVPLNPEVRTQGSTELEQKSRSA